jgi:hypothetical protein
MKSRLLAAAALLAACSHTPTPAPASAPAPASVPAPAHAEALGKSTVESTRRYDFLMGAGRAGEEIVTTRGNESVIHFEFNDRGRGPKTDTTLTTDSQSVIRSLKTSGNDYLKSAVAETFAVDNGRAAWKNDSENANAADSGAFYLSMNGAPEEVGVLAKAMLAAPGHKVQLLPAGEATIKRLGDTTIEHDGHPQHVTCYAVGGLSFSPFPIWLDDANNLFASVSSWSSLIREGWGRDEAQKLIDMQSGWEGAERVAVTERLSHHPTGGALVITNARLFDPMTHTATPSTTVVIRGNRIESVGADGSITLPAGAERIDAQGRTLLPGLFDMHQHLSEGDGLLDIGAGVTSARDLGNDVDFLVGLKKKYDSNALVGPRVVVMAALIDGPGKYTGPTKLVVDSEDDFRKVLDKVVPLGFEQTKIYSSIRPELVPFIARLSHEHGMRVSGHIPAGMRAEEAVRAGYDEIQHANMLVLNFLPDVKDTRTPARFTAVAERAADLDLNSAEVKAFLELLRSHKTVIDPTLAVFEDMFLGRKGEVSPGYVAIAERVPAQVRRNLLTGGLPVPDGMDARYRASFAKMLALVKAAYDAGVPIVAGTDALSGFTLHRELELYVLAGIPAPEVLRIATLGAAQVARREGQLGSITPGKLADMILVDGDPLTNISDIRRVTTVVKDGIVFDAAAVEGEIGVRTMNAER